MKDKKNYYEENRITNQVYKIHDYILKNLTKST